MPPPLPAHEATTRHLGAAYPFAAEPGFATSGTIVGRDLLGGTFCYDPFDLYRSGAITNPNMVVFGQIGRGKSAFVKSYLWRQSVLGRRSWVVDPKGEYAALARALGTEPVSLRPGGSIRLNPLDAQGSACAPCRRTMGEAAATGGEGDRESEIATPRRAAADDLTRRRAELLGSLTSASLGRSLLPPERAAIEMAVAEVSRRGEGRRSSPAAHGAERNQVLSTPAPTLPEVVEVLLRPSATSASALCTDVAGLAADGRNVALELRRLVSGDLAGMFDGPTSGVRFDGPLVVLDLSAVYHSAALGVLMTCAAAWLQAAILGARAPGAGTAGEGGTRRNDNTILVVDEAWAILANLGVARWLQSTWKLSRAWGVSNIAVLHRVSDLAAAGSTGSEQVGLAQGLLADSETRVVYGQPPGEVELAAAMLGLSSTEAELVPQLQRGVALWKVAGRSFLVQHRLAPDEACFVDTDSAMAP